MGPNQIDRAGRQGLRWVREFLLASVPAVLLASYPISVIVGANLGVVPLDGRILGRSLAVAASVVLVIMWASKVFQRDLVTRAAWVSWILIVFGLYGTVRAALGSLGLALEAGDPTFAAPYALFSVATATLIANCRQSSARNLKALTIFAVVMVASGVGPGMVNVAGSSFTQWRAAADRLTAPIDASALERAAGPRRDIYYIVLDGFGRADTLERLYGVDLSPFLDFLRSRGFDVADQARSNYGQTFLSLASTLNMNYLDDLASTLGPDNRDRRPLAYAIQRNAVMKMATTAGYHVIGIGSDYLATERLAGADSCFCRQYGLDEIEQSALALTPLGALPIDRWTYDAHRRKVSESFGALESTAAQSGAKFVFAHIITPHPPFVFHADGRPRDPLQGVVFSFADGDHYRGTRGTYLEGYRQQVQFATRQLMTLIERLLAQPEPTPVIVIHGDHGPGSILRWEHRGGTSFRERLSIFAAYRFPGGDAAVYSTITPVNGMRMLANRYFGTSLPLLPDKSFFSKWSRPYEFIPNDSTAVDARTN